MATLLTYARAAAPLVPGASRLPFVAGGGGEMPELERVRNDVEVDREHLATYAEVCGFEPRDELPATYPHVLAFPLHMALMTDGRFPFPAVGLVHIANRDRAAPADRRRASAWRCACTRRRSSPTPRPGVRDRHRGARRRRAGVARAQHDAAPRRGQRQRA